MRRGFMKKILISILMIMSLVVIPVAADEEVPGVARIPRYVCLTCGSTNTSSVPKLRKTTKVNVACIHGKQGSDQKVTYTYDVTVTCNDCGKVRSAVWNKVQYNCYGY